MFKKIFNALFNKNKKENKIAWRLVEDYPVERQREILKDFEGIM